MNWSRLNPRLDAIGIDEAQPTLESNALPLPRELSLQQLTVRVATSWDEVEALRPFWQVWNNGLHTDIDYYLQNLKNDVTAIGPYVICVYKYGDPFGMLVGQVKERRVSTMVSMVRIEGPHVRHLEIVTEGRLGPESREVDALLLEEIARALEGGNVDMVYFHRLPMGSSLFQGIWQLPYLFPRKRLMHVVSYSKLPLTALPGKRPPVFSGKIMREARRKTQNLQRDYPGRVVLRCFAGSKELQEGLGAVAAVDAGTWQNSLGTDFTDPLHTVDSFRYFSEKGWLRIFVLYVEERPRAFLIGQIHGKTFHCEHAGYHADFRKYSVGSILTSWAFENLAAAGVERIDLGEGGQEHNRRLGCEKLDESTVHLYAPTIRGLALSLFFGTAETGRHLGSRARSRLHLEWVARVWRKSLVSRRAKTAAGENSDRFGTTKLGHSPALSGSPRNSKACG